MRKSIVILAGMSGSGKSTILTDLTDNNNYEKIITSTTRLPRVGEVDGVDYFFLKKDDFIKKVEDGLFLEYVEIKNHFYGVGLNSFSKDFKGKKPILILDPKGVVVATKKLSELNWRVVSCFINETQKTCITRVIGRKSCNSEKLKRVQDIKTAEKNWATFTNYSMFTVPNETIKEISKSIDKFNIKGATEKEKIKKNSNKKNIRIKI